MTGRPTPAEALKDRRRDYVNALLALEIDPHHHGVLIAACEAVAKARAIDALATFVDTRRSDPTSLGPN